MGPVGNHVALGVFIVEALLKMLAFWPRPFRYFRDGWNIFDFTVIVFALVPSTGQFAMVARLARLLREIRATQAALQRLEDRMDKEGRSERQGRVTHVAKYRALFPWKCGQAMLCLL